MDLPGSRVGSSYMLIEEVGAGATGRVWRALDRDSGDEVAVKLLRRELMNEPKAVTRFVQERSILLMLRHDNIVRLRDLLTVGSSLGLVMDLVDGGSLRAYLRRNGTLPASLAAELLAQVADALAEAHRLGVVHRDLKPDNILLEAQPQGFPAVDSYGQPVPSPGTPLVPRPARTPRLLPEHGPVPHVRLTDFGIARLLDSPGVTTPQSMVGTPNYLAPEVISGEAPSPAVDVYALGVLLYELLLGRPPYASGPPIAVLRRHLECEPRRYPGIPDQAWQAVLACMARQPERRPSARAAADLLRRVARQLSGVPAAPPAGDLVPEQAHLPHAAPARPAQRWRRMAGLSKAARPSGAGHCPTGGRPSGAGHCPTGGRPPRQRVGKRRRPGGWLSGRRTALVSLAAVCTVFAMAGSVADGVSGWLTGTAASNPPAGASRLSDGSPRLPEFMEQPALGGQPQPVPPPTPAPPASSITPKGHPAAPIPGPHVATASRRASLMSPGNGHSPEATRQAPGTARPSIPPSVYGPLLCTSTFRWDVGHPAVARPCHATGPGIELYGRMRALPEVRTDVSLTLEDVETGTTVAGPFTCTGLTFTEDVRERSCGPFHITDADRGRHYAVVQRWTYPVDSGLPSGMARTDPFQW